MTKLSAEMIEKPWGRTELPEMFGSTGGRRIGEVWLSGGDDLPLLVKYLFTSERLSIQVHPNDEQARSRGLASGKTECWYILDAEEGASLGLGLKESIAAEALRSAALDGSIEQLMNWQPVHSGDVIFVPAGTVHAIGGGISLLELQQNGGTTYRLYDYGRPRELHLDEALAVADLRPFAPNRTSHVSSNEPAILVDAEHFCLVQAVGGQVPAEGLAGRRRWVMPLQGRVVAGGEEAGPGECLVVDEEVQLDLGEGQVLIGAEGPL